MLFGSRLNKLATSIRRGISKYSVGSDNPGLVFDFIDNFYQKDKNQTVNFDGAITHARAGNATMTDGYGPELVTNGGFDSDSDWTKGTGWSIADGRAISAGHSTHSSISQSYSFTSGKVYEVKYTITNYGSGNFSAQLSGGGTVTGAIRSSNGTYTELLTATANHTSVNIRSNDGNGIGSIDNVSVREMPVIKWGPHNLLTYSEDFSNAAWSISNGTINDSETISFTATSGAVTGALATTSAGAGYTVAVELWSETDAGKQVDIGFNTNNLSNTFSDSITLTSTPTLYTFSKANNTATQNSLRIRNADSLSKTFKVRYAHLYRSDLGGMVDNPERGDSYVPTTSSDKYLPRVGHHVYNGSAWVNEGVLAESEARTNLVTYSEDLSNAAWALTGASFDTATNELTGTSASGGYARFTPSYTDNTVYTFSVYLKRNTLGWAWIYLRDQVSTNHNAYVDLTNGVFGTIAGTANWKITDEGDGWYRVSGSYDSGAAGASEFVQIQLASDDGDNTLTSGEGIYVKHCQLEAGSTPSSLIPTSGQQRTREAESFTIPSANLPWPTPQYIGSELQGNAQGDNSQLSGVYSGAATSYLSVTNGSVYRISVTISDYTAGLFDIGDNADRNIVVNNLAANGTYVYYFVPDDGTLYFTADANSDFTLDVTVREINPLSVSIGMEGRMTYADTDSFEEVFPFQWFADGTRYISNKVRTTSFRTGQLYFSQREATSGLDEVITLSTLFNPDILVPYSLAGRYGSTFINGAVDGVALTANTTPTALPDLSSTDLSLAYDYMGTISEFRVWDKDIGDAGIVEATNPSLEPSLSLTFEGTGTNSFVVNNWSE